MSWLPEFREVRVTARVSITTPFIAPDQAPVSVLNRELAKGLVGWTDFETVPEEIGYRPKTGLGVSNHLPEGFADRALNEATVGSTVIRRIRVKAPTANVTGPTDRHAAMRIRAEALAARNTRP